MPKSITFDNDFLKLIFNATAIANIADNAATAPLTNIYLSLHTADLLAFLNAVAALTGSGDITTAARSALGWFGAAISGGGNITNATPYATGALAASILSYTELTSEGVRDKVWQGLAADFNESGTMGQKLNSAGSAGDPWITQMSGYTTQGTFGWLMQKLLTLGRFLGLK